jgi:hypothetical protein
VGGVQHVEHLPPQLHLVVAEAERARQAHGRALSAFSTACCASKQTFGARVTVAALGIGAALTIARPERGPHDWLLGTWFVPR